MRTPRFLAVLLVPLLALVLAACGGDDEGGGGGESASSDTDVNQLLTDTFTGQKQMDSGNIAMTLELTAEGQANEDLGGPVNVSLNGPFDARDKEAFPKFALEASFSGAGQSFEGGATSTGDKGFVSFQGTNYVLDDATFQQFIAGYEQARQQAESQTEENQSLATLGMDPRAWLVDPQNAGEAEVGDTETIKITAGIDVPKMLDDVNKALENAAALTGGAAGQVPQQLTEEQRQEIENGIKDPKVEIYTGAEDKTMRRLVVDLGIEDESGTGALKVDFSITGLNEEQDISEPSDPQPFQDLLGQLGGLGLGAGAGAAGGSADPAAGGGASAEDLEAYSQCLTEAGSDADAARACADLLAP